ncbi:hypothetical protein LCGC14_1967080, partial [marine sediment metagenome]
SKTIEMPVGRIMRDATLYVHVTGVRVWCWRLWLTRQIIHFGVWVSGMRGNVKVSSDDG